MIQKKTIHSNKTNYFKVRLFRKIKQYKTYFKTVCFAEVHQNNNSVSGVRPQFTLGKKPCSGWSLFGIMLVKSCSVLNRTIPGRMISQER